VFTLWIGWRRGAPIHALEVFGAVFFAVLAALGLMAPGDVIRWLEAWAGEVSSVSLALFAVVTLLIGKPFTIAYAKDSTPSEHWDTSSRSRSVSPPIRRNPSSGSSTGYRRSSW
jgi:membrane protein implicated in regulation of membrane protease activity